jgi:hypothetical protein
MSDLRNCERKIPVISSEESKPVDRWANIENRANAARMERTQFTHNPHEILDLVAEARAQRLLATMHRPQIEGYSEFTAFIVDRLSTDQRLEIISAWQDKKGRG